MTLILLALALSPYASSAEWEEKSFPTAEGDTLIAGKKGRMYYSMRIESAEKADAINCIGFYGFSSRTALALAVKTAGTRAKGSTQVGEVSSYSDSLTRMRLDKNVAAMAGFGMPICALGIDSFPETVVFTLGSMYKSQGRTATLDGTQTELLGAWFLEQ
jgi:hypothetical protein